MIASLILPQHLRDQIAQEAQAAHPNECCGLIEGSYKHGETNLSLSPSGGEGRVRGRLNEDGVAEFASPAKQIFYHHSRCAAPSPNPLPPRGRGQNDDTFPDPATTEIRAHACHPARNLAAAPDRFEIDPARHIALLRDLRGTNRSIVGCYHSHPNGRPEPSPRDLESAADEDFVWLVEAGGTLAAFLHRDGAFHNLRLA